MGVHQGGRTGNAYFERKGRGGVDGLNFSLQILEIGDVHLLRVFTV